MSGWYVILDPDESDVIIGVLESLADPVRLEIITYFETHPQNPIVLLEELVGILARRFPLKTQEELCTLAYQAHLPILEDNDWLLFDRDELMIMYYGRTDAREVMRYLLDVFNTQDP